MTFVVENSPNIIRINSIRVLDGVFQRINSTISNKATNWLTYMARQGALAVLEGNYTRGRVEGGTNFEFRDYDYVNNKDLTPEEYCKDPNLCSYPAEFELLDQN